MSHLDTGITGAKRATWREMNPRKLLREIIEADAKADEETWRDKFWQKITKGLPNLSGSYLEAIIDYWLDNNIHSLINHEKVESQRATTKAEVARVKRKVEALVLMNLQMPNGKTLGECTGADCKHFGGWYVKVSESVPAAKRVSDVLSEAKLRKLWHER